MGEEDRVPTFKKESKNMFFSPHARILLAHTHTHNDKRC